MSFNFSFPPAPQQLYPLECPVRVRSHLAYICLATVKELSSLVSNFHSLYELDCCVQVFHIHYLTTLPSWLPWRLSNLTPLWGPPCNRATNLPDLTPPVSHPLLLKIQVLVFRLPFLQHESGNFLNLKTKNQIHTCPTVDPLGQPEARYGSA